ncbi:glycosyltransferase [Ruegeria arenilitoris]|uniref:glycosyltransferase n=1 Tax=Ruegeria arenilitoris TaxID=1173585 RepID=UPI00147F3742|nr:glycosyltransferase [Ruegeria arenilitoris]
MTDLVPSRVVILSDFAKIRGGASKLAVLQAELLAEQGIPVTYFCGDDGDRLNAGIELISMGGQSLLERGGLSAAASGIWNYAVQKRLANWIKMNDCGGVIYHVHGYHQTLSPSLLWPLKQVKSRTVMHAHDYFLSCPNGAFFDFRGQSTCPRLAMSGSCILHNCDKRNYGQKLWRVLRQALQNQARNRLLPDVTTLLIHSGMERLLFPDGTSGPVVAIANPSEPLLSQPVASQLNSEFVYVGDIHAYKGVFLLAEAGRKAGVKVRFVGDGQDLHQLRTSFPEHQFDGWQDRVGLQRAMTNARMLVAPTLGPEPFGLAPVEALLSGVPVLVSDSLLLSQEIRTLNMGLNFSAGDSEALAAAMRDLSQDDNMILQMASNARRGARNISHTPENWCAELLNVYQEILWGMNESRRAEHEYARTAS